MLTKDQMRPELVRQFELERKTVNELAQWIEDAKEQAEYNTETGHPDDKLQMAIQEAEQDYNARNSALEARGF